MWKLKTKGIPLNAVVFVNGCMALSSTDGRIHSHQPQESAELRTAVSAVRNTRGDALASVTAAWPQKGPLVPAYMTVNTDMPVRWA